MKREIEIKSANLNDIKTKNLSKMETKHTKGEWMQQEGLSLTGLRRVLTKEKTICEIYATNFNSDEEFEANVKLIASVADLLEACIDAKNRLEKLMSHKDWVVSPFGSVWAEFEKLENVIKKATE